MPYKQRLIIEGYGCRKNLDSRSFALSFFEKLSRLLDMRILVPPMVVRVPVPAAAEPINTSDHGVTGFVIWMESGAQLHTWPGERVATLDAYSCKPFEISMALGLFHESFVPLDMEFLSPNLERDGRKGGQA